jgi:hypothetical protein
MRAGARLTNGIMADHHAIASRNHSPKNGVYQPVRHPTGRQRVGQQVEERHVEEVEAHQPPSLRLHIPPGVELGRGKPPGISR